MRKAKLLFNNKEIEAEIAEEEVEKLNFEKRTGYERNKRHGYYVVGTDGVTIHSVRDDDSEIDREFYKAANYYTDEQLAKDCARADTLLRCLRRFSAEHRAEQIDWNNNEQPKYWICCNYRDGKIRTTNRCHTRAFGQIYFDSEEAAELAIETFKDELEWYFTEFKDCL